MRCRHCRQLRSEHLELELPGVYHSFPLLKCLFAWALYAPEATYLLRQYPDLADVFPQYRR